MSRFASIYLRLMIFIPLAVSSSFAAAEHIKAGGSDVEVVIQNETSFGINIGQFRAMPLRVTDVRFSNNKFKLDKTPILGDGALELKFKMQFPNGRYGYLPLPEKVKKQILKYFNSGYSGPCDCNCFAHYVNEVDFEFGRLKNSSWITSEISTEAILSPGDTIMIGKSENEITHLAVYLGEGLYLSKFGTFGGLIVTTLRGMKMGFGGTKTWLTRPARLDSGGAPIVNSGAR